MATNKLQWKRIAKGDKLPCQSFLRKKNGEILKLSTIGGVTVGQDAYYIPVDEVIEEIRNYPIEESEDEKIIKEIKQFIRSRGMSLAQSKVDSWIAWLEKQGELTDIPADAVLDSNENGLIADTIRCKTEKSYEHWSDEQIRINLLSFVNTWGKAKLPLTSVNMFVNYLEKQGEQQPAEWSEEDEKMVQVAINACNSYQDSLVRNDSRFDKAVKAEEWLKSLKDRCTWKPSKRQIQSVRNCALNENIDAGTRLIFDTLYQDLKKLRDE